MFAVNEKKLVFPVRITEKKKEKHVNLLYISNKTNNPYVLIKDMSRLLAKQINNHNFKGTVPTNALECMYKTVGN